MTQQPSIATIFSPLFLTLSSNIHEFQNVIGGSDLDTIEEEAIVGPSVGFGFIPYALPRGEFGDLSKNIAFVLIGDGIDVCKIILQIQHTHTGMKGMY